MDTENNSSNSLNADAAKRLKKLISEWDKDSGSCCSEKLRVQDLRLLLENFKPLRNLIYSIANQQPNQLATEEPKQPPVETTTENIDSYKQAVTEATEELTKTKDLLVAAKEKIATLNTEIEKQAQANNKLQKELLEYKQNNQDFTKQHEIDLKERQQLTTQLSQAKQEIKDCQLKLAAQNQNLNEVDFLRQESDLAKRLDLDVLPNDNTQALIKIVAVLAQKDNLERLWQALKSRCEEEQRAATTAELQLLNTALSWYNYNWRSKPFQLIDAPSDSSYNYEQHQKSTHTTTGETIHALHLPGLADGSGKPFCKALVNTR